MAKVETVSALIACPLFYAKGKTVYQRPNKGAIGFAVCECADDIIGDAERVIVEALNLVAEMADVQPADGERVNGIVSAWLDRARKIMKDD